MKNTFRFAAAVAACFVMTLSAEEIEWDFSKGTKPNGPYEFKLSSTAEVKDGAMYFPVVGKTSGAGLYSVKKYPELTPSGAFRITFVFTLEDARSSEPCIFLWDNKADYYEKGTGDPKDNSGMTIALYRPKTSKTMSPRAWFGMGKKTATLRGGSINAVPGKKYVFELEYDGVENYTFYSDGKPCGKGKVVPGGKISPAQYTLAIGNRCVGNFFPFDGKLHSVKLVTKTDEGTSGK